MLARSTTKSDFLANHSIAAVASSGFTGVLFWYPAWVLIFGPSFTADIFVVATLLFFTVTGATSVLAVVVCDLVARMARPRRIKITEKPPVYRREPVLSDELDQATSEAKSEAA